MTAGGPTPIWRRELERIERVAKGAAADAVDAARVVSRMHEHLDDQVARILNDIDAHKKSTTVQLAQLREDLEEARDESRQGRERILQAIGELRELYRQTPMLVSQKVSESGTHYAVRFEQLEAEDRAVKREIELHQERWRSIRGAIWDVAKFVIGGIIALLLAWLATRVRGGRATMRLARFVAIDDSEADRQLLARWWSKRIANPLALASAVDSLTPGAMAPDVVVLDLVMPVTDGADALRMMAWVWPRARFVIHSGYPSDEMVNVIDVVLRTTMHVAEPGGPEVAWCSKDERDTQLVTTIAGLPGISLAIKNRTASFYVED